MPDKHVKPHPQLRAVPATAANHGAQPGRRLYGQLLAEIAAGTAVLPSPHPKIARQVARGIQAAAHGRRVARLLGADPALSAKVLRAACATGQLRRPRTLPVAVDYLGRHYVSGLASRVLEDGLLQTRDQELRQLGHDCWQRSLRVSTISYLLATLDGRFDPEEAALAGLLHNLGELALLGRAAREDRPGMREELHRACRYYSAEAGRELARNWGLPGSLARVAGSMGDWHRDHEGRADMADLVLVAQLHARLGQAQADYLPSLKDMPAFQQLELGRADPRFSLGLMEAARNALALTQRQLATAC